VRVAAIKEMFDRGFGRATQPIEGSVTYGVSEQLAELSPRKIDRMRGCPWDTGSASIQVL
jgi:hypothetical protein